MSSKCTTTIARVNLLCTSKDVEINNTIFVDSEFGNDNTGKRENLNYPYQTINTAILNSNNGDTIYVHPGIYEVSEIVLCNNLNFHFSNGSKVISSTNIFVVNSPTSSNITGFAWLESQYLLVVDKDGNNSVIYLECLYSKGGLVLVESYCNINFSINQIFNFSTKYPLMNLHSDCEIVLKFNSLDSDGTIYLDRIGATVVISGKITKLESLTSSAFIYTRLSNLIVTIDEIVANSEVDSSFILSTLNEICHELNKIFNINSLSISGSLNLATLTNSSLVLNITKIEYSSTPSSIILDSSILDVDVREIQIDTGLYLLEASNFSTFKLTSATIISNGSKLVKATQKSENRLTLYITAAAISSNSSLFLLEGNVLCISNIDKICVENHKDAIIKSSKGVEFNLTTNRFEVTNNVSNIFIEHKSGIALYNIGTLYLNTNSDTSIITPFFDLNLDQISNISVDRLEMLGRRSTYLSSFNSSITTSNISSAIIETGHEFYTTFKSKLSSTIDIIENEIDCLILDSRLSVIKLVVGVFTSSRVGAINSVDDEYFSLTFDSIECDAVYQEDVSLFSISRTTVSYVKGNYLNVKGPNVIFAAGNSASMFVEISTIVHNGNDSFINISGAMNLNLNSDSIKLSSSLINSSNGTNISGYISRIESTSASGFIFNILSNSNLFVEVNHIESGRAGVLNLVDANDVNFSCNYSNTQESFALIDLSNTSNLTFSGYFVSKSSTFVFSSVSPQAKVRFKSSTIVTENAWNYSLASPVSQLTVQMEPSLANRATNNINVIPNSSLTVLNSVS